MYRASWLIVLLSTLIVNPALALKDCNAKQMAKLLAKATKKRPAYLVKCNVNLKKNDIITKRLVFLGKRSSGANFNCHNALIAPIYKGNAILIRSEKSKKNQQWIRPKNITLKNCRLIGSIRLRGMDQKDDLASSRKRGHTLRAQMTSPTHITFDKLKQKTTGRVAIYVGVGSTYINIINSNISGQGNSTAIYLDAESAHNTIANNTIHVNSKKREQIAIDGSAYNKIINNRFASLSQGGIFLYRNCGERGNIRHQTPSYNLIKNNVFYYDRYRGRNPAIWVASRNGNRDYCHIDKGYPFGSSLSNLDFARHNIITNNRIYKRSIKEMIKVNDAPNTIHSNRGHL